MFKFLNLVWLIETFLTLRFGGSSAPAPTNTTVQNTNIPDYAQPYVMNMLGATEKQLFNTDASGNITGFNAYQPYSTNPQNYVAGFSPLQQSAQRGASNLQMPGQYGQASQMADMAGLGSLGVAGQAGQAGNNYFGMATNPGATQAFMNPYLQSALNPALDEARRQYGITGQQEQGSATQAGAFGGSREALMASENNRNMNTAMNQMIGQGYNNAYNQAQQNILAGNQLGLQGQQAALQGYGQMGQDASTLGQLGQQQLQGQEGILNLQNQYGQQEQQNQQNIINQSVQNYANAQQYPMMQLGMMSNMLRGLPMQGMTTQQYQAQPSFLNQTVGLAGALANQAPVKSSKKGGILEADNVKRYNIGSAVKANIASLTTPQLQQSLQSAASNIEKGDIKAELANRAAGSSPTIAAAQGGILSFTEGSPGKYEPSADQDWTDEYRLARNAAETTKANEALKDKYPDMVPTPANTIPYAPTKYVGATPYDAAIEYYKGEKQRPTLGFETQRETINPAIVALNDRRTAWLEGKKDPITGEAPVGSKYNPQGIMLTEAQAAKPAETKAKDEPAKVDNTKKENPAADNIPKGNPKSILAADLNAPTMDEVPLSQEQKDIMSGKTKPISEEDAIQQQKDIYEKFMPKEIIAAREKDRKLAMQSENEIASDLEERRRVNNQNMWLKIGSTPGPLLAALTKSWAEKNLADVQDTQWGRDAKAKAHELIAKFNDSDYLLQKGHIDAGMKTHDDAVKELQQQAEAYAKRIEAGNKIKSDIFGHQVSRENNAAQVAAEDRRTDVAKTSANNETTREEKNANDSYTRILADAGKLYKDDPDADKKITTFVNNHLPAKHRKVLGLDDIAMGPISGDVVTDKSGKKVWQPNK